MTDETTKSKLPPLEQVREETTMRIITVNTFSYPKTLMKTSMRQTGSRGAESVITAQVIKLTDPRIQGFMPSKVWWDDINRSFDILFYVNTTLPKAVRPFKDNTYFMYFYPSGYVVEYDATMRVFIDQIKTNIGMAYVFMFGDETYNDIINDPDRKVASYQEAIEEHQR
jgi:hypothetical protein